MKSIKKRYKGFYILQLRLFIFQNQKHLSSCINQILNNFSEKNAVYFYINHPKLKSLQLTNPHDLLLFDDDLFSPPRIKPVTNKKVISEFPFYKKLIEKPIFKPFANRKLLSKLPFYICILDKPKITKKSKAFKNYAQCYAVKVLENKLKDLLDEMTGFKFHKMVKVILRKELENVETKYLLPIYFNSKTQIVPNYLCIDDSLNTSYETILSRTQKWIGEGSVLKIESIDGVNINISFHDQLVGSSYIKLPFE